MLQLARARLGAEAVATVCDLRASSKHELMHMEDAIGVRRRRDKRTQAIAQLHHWDLPIYDSEFPLLLTVRRLVRGAMESEHLERYGLLSSVLSMPPGTQPRCDIVALNVSASSPASRSVLVLDASRLLGMTPVESANGKPPLLIMHGAQECLNESYVGMAWKEHTERCWQSAWARLLDQQSIFGPSCVSDERTTNAKRTCAAWVNTSTGCTRRQPLLSTPSKKAQARRDGGTSRRIGRSRIDGGTASGDIVEAQASSADHSCRLPTVRFERIIFRSRNVRSHVSASLRYYTVVQCEGESGGVGIHRHPSRAMCLLFKQGITERWVGGLRSLDGGYTFEGEVELAMPSINPMAIRRGDNWGLPHSATMTHNYA